MTPKLEQNVYLIGFMGAGKTTISRRLAKKLGCASVDLDFYIEREAGDSISDIFKNIGESGFRDLETYCLKRVSSFKGKSIISTGGGIIERPENAKIMRNTGVVIHLLTDVEYSFARINDTSTRPLFKDRKSVQKKYDERIDKYRDAADITIDTRGQATSKVIYFCQRELSKQNIVSYK